MLSPIPEIRDLWECWNCGMLKSRFTQRTAAGCDQTGLVLFYGGPASLPFAPCDHGTQPGEMSQALLSFLLLLLRAGLKWLLSSRSLRKNKIWFAIPCST